MRAGGAESPDSPGRAPRAPSRQEAAFHDCEELVHDVPSLLDVNPQRDSRKPSTAP